MDNPDSEFKLIYIDDVVNEIINDLQSIFSGIKFGQVFPEYMITTGELAKKIENYKIGRENMIIESVGSGIDRALYSTYISNLPKGNFAYQVAQHCDERGVFVEMLKTSSNGQFSFFTAHPGVTRGSHFHHTKTEKFLVIQGNALFRYRDISSGDVYEFKINSKKSMIVDTIPGWAHEVTNIGQDDLIVMLWANEVFDQDNPDTFMSEV